MKKFFITCILVGSFVPLFQNCGKQAHNGNGDPYEGTDPQLQIGDDYQSELTSQTGIGELVSVCTGTGLIKRVEFSKVGTGVEMISFTHKDNKSLSVKNNSAVDSLSLNLKFSNGVEIQSLNIFTDSITIGVESAGSVNFEQLSCIAYR